VSIEQKRCFDLYGGIVNLTLLLFPKIAEGRFPHSGLVLEF